MTEDLDDTAILDDFGPDGEMADEAWTIEFGDE